MSEKSNPWQGPVAPARILVVDDDAAARAAVSRTLGRRGHSVVALATSEQALRQLAEHDFDLAILDIHLESGDGIELLRQIKARAPECEALMLSGANSIEIAIRSVHAGAFDFIEKPFSTERLTLTAERALEHRRLRQTTALYQTVQVIFRTRDFERLPEAIVRVSMDVMRADGAALLLPGLDGTFYVGYAFGSEAAVARTIQAPVGEDVAQRAARSRTLLVLQGDPSDPTAIDGAPARAHTPSILVYPLVLGDEVLALLSFSRSTGDFPFGPADSEKAAVLASQVLLALENARLARQNVTSEKLAAVGQLAAGIAHEINTPIQFMRDSLHFLSEAFRDLARLTARLQEIVEPMRADELPESGQSLLREARELADDTDLSYLKEAVPRALERTAEGATRIAKIVQAVQEFGRPDPAEKVAVDLNECLRSTLLVVSGELNHLADVETEFGDVPLVSCRPGEINQVFLSLILNAGHAVAAVVLGSKERGKIVVRTQSERNCAIVSIEDTGAGIPVEAQSRVFDPFFTTKTVGRGVGLGLSIARTIVERHGGSLTFETQSGRGTRFSIRLPFDVAGESDAQSPP
ncbi:MAG: response regulator [Polyangiaceae bacterium]|jgi:two-component system, NtrC family, sensor kinase